MKREKHRNLPKPDPSVHQVATKTPQLPPFRGFLEDPGAPPRSLSDAMGCRSQIYQKFLSATSVTTRAVHPWISFPPGFWGKLCTSSSLAFTNFSPWSLSYLLKRILRGFFWYSCLWHNLFRSHKREKLVWACVWQWKWWCLLFSRIGYPILHSNWHKHHRSWPKNLHCTLWDWEYYC